MAELWIDGVCQGKSDQYGNPISPYMKIIAEYEPKLPRKADCLFLGGGAFILPDYFHSRGHYVSTVEKSKPDPHRPMVFWTDARVFLKEVTGPRYNFILLDCYVGKKKPYGLYDKKSLLAMKQLLTSHGTLGVNYIPSSPRDTITFYNLLYSLFGPMLGKDLINDTGKLLQTVYFCKKGTK